jgi:hypothetical protein
MWLILDILFDLALSVLDALGYHRMTQRTQERRQSRRKQSPSPARMPKTPSSRRPPSTTTPAMATTTPRAR